RDGLDLLVGARGPTGPTLLVAYNNGAGVLDAFARSESAFDRLTPALPLAAADLNGDGKADYVSGDAVWITDYGLPAVPGPPVALVPLAFRVGDAPWSDAAIGDLNGDARPDVAVAFDGTDGIDVYLGTASGLFNKFHVDTAGPPFALRTGDFDGDLVGDLAFAISGLGAAPDEVAVAFGSPAGGPEPPIVMGQLDFVRILEPMSSVVDLESVDAIADLLVLSDEFPDRDAVSIAILTGNSGRRMLAPFTLQYEDENGDQFDVPSRLAVGDFVPLRDAAGDDHLDIITVAQPQRNLDGTSEVPEPEPADRVFHMWRVPSDGPGAALNALNASFTELPAGAEFEARCGEWTPADLDGDGFHEIVGLDGSWSCYGGVDSPPPSIVVADVAGDLGVTRFGLDVPYRAPDKLAAADLDADGDDDLLVLFRGQARPSAGGNTSDPAEGAAIVVWWNDGGELQLASESSFVVPGAHLLFDVAPARLSGDDDIPELVVLTDAGLFAASLDPDTATYQDLHRLVGEPAEGRLAVGDVDGDGLDDVAFTDGTGDVHVYLGRAAPPLGGVVGDAVAVPDQGGAP
ncbi:MAG: VCBS repeat-containing protein, partial [Deltaproteobacteria bacterium]